MNTTNTIQTLRWMHQVMEKRSQDREQTTYETRSLKALEEAVRIIESGLTFEQSFLSVAQSHMSERAFIYLCQKAKDHRNAIKKEAV